jgi:hypothetical protein
MADTKISALTGATSLDGTEQLPVVQSGSTKVATTAQLLAFIKGTYYPQVANYAALPAATGIAGDIYVVQTTTGLVGLRKFAGLWRSNGTSWDYLGDIYLTATDTPFTPASGIVSTDVQSAIVEVETTLLTHIGSGGANHAQVVAAGASGFMSGADKTKLDGISGTNTGDQTSVSGNAGTATKFATARNINGVSFDGTANITVNAVDSTSRVPTTRLISTTAPLSGGGDLSADRTLSISAFSSTVAGIVPLSGGGTANYLRADGSWSTPPVGTGTVTAASITTANGISGTVATATTTPAITLTLGAITPSSVAATGTVTGSNLSGTNTGDQTTVSGNAGTATKLVTARTINGTSFDGSANITIPNFSTTLAGMTPASTTADAKRLHADATWSDEYAAICFIIDGGGATITTGIKGDLTIPFACTIMDWTILADQSGSIVVNAWKDTLANYPPTVTVKITASLPPTITTATKANSTTLTGWTTAVAAGDVIRFNVDSVTTIQRATITLKVKKA